MFENLYAAALKHKGPVTVGTLALLLAALLSYQMRAQSAEASSVRTELFKLFETHRKETREMATNQWQNQGKIAEGLQAVALQLARIESLMRIPIEKRPPIPETAPMPKAIELKPPMK